MPPRFGPTLAFFGPRNVHRSQTLSLLPRTLPLSSRAKKFIRSGMNFTAEGSAVGMMDLYGRSLALPYFFIAFTSCPPWCRIKCVTSPLSFLKNSTWASTTLRKNLVSDSAKSGNFGCPVACVIN